LFILLNRVKTCFKLHFSENSIPFLSYHSLHRLCDWKLVVYISVEAEGSNPTDIMQYPIPMNLSMW
jgi:hypothetical protein